ncbi:MAG: hypothetical protein HC815_41480, partial [Richelia sp. RM1_1_1]|nr:hypothetical protein [Richelia sp. RM1_1_1]
QKYLEDKRYEISVIESAEITGELRGRKEAKLEIARVMKARGIEISLIVETTGLNLEDVEKL